MFLFVGLGNIGQKYEDTPHNAGFAFLDEFREFLGWDSLYTVDNWKVDKLFESQICSVRAGSSTRAKLVKPTTYVNASGRPVSLLLKKLELQPQKSLILIHDDLDIKLGEYKIQRGKGPHAHNGVDSVQMMVGTTDFLRVRIGIENRPSENRMPGEDYVLAKMKTEELALLKETYSDIVKSLRNVIEL